MQTFSSDGDFALIRLEDDDKIYLERLTQSLNIKFDEILRLFKLKDIQYFDDYHYEWIIATFQFSEDRNEFLKIINFNECPESRIYDDYYDLVRFLDISINDVRNEAKNIQKIIYS